MAGGARPVAAGGRAGAGRQQPRSRHRRRRGALPPRSLLPAVRATLPRTAAARAARRPAGADPPARGAGGQQVRAADHRRHPRRPRSAARPSVARQRARAGARDRERRPAVQPGQRARNRPLPEPRRRGDGGGSAGHPRSWANRMAMRSPTPNRLTSAPSRSVWTRSNGRRSGKPWPRPGGSKHERPSCWASPATASPSSSSAWGWTPEGFYGPTSPLEPAFRRGNVDSRGCHPAPCRTRSSVRRRPDSARRRSQGGR